MSKKHMAMLLASMLALFAVTAGYWLHGYDFNERGGEALGWYLLSLLAAFFAAGFAGTGDFKDE